MEHRGDGAIAAEDEDDPGDEHAREGGGAVAPGSASNPGLCRLVSTLLTGKYSFLPELVINMIASCSFLTLSLPDLLDFFLPTFLEFLLALVMTMMISL